jgi:hypothetical protein
MQSSTSRQKPIRSCTAAPAMVAGVGDCLDPGPHRKSIILNFQQGRIMKMMSIVLRAEVAAG